MEDGKNVEKEVKLLPENFKESRGPTGKLSWTTKNTRPDIAYSAREGSTRNREAYYVDLKYAYGNLIALCKEGERGDETIYQARMVKEIYTLYDSSHSTKLIDEKSIRHLTAWIKEQMEDAIMEKVIWIPNKEMTIDSFTYEKIKSEVILSIISGGSVY